MYYIGHKINNTVLYITRPTKQKAISYIVKWREKMLKEGVLLFIDLKGD
jgi:hypothetical protein